jgi:hypothetical protein
MSGLDVIFLIVAIVVIAGAVGAFLTREQKSLKEMTKDYYNNEEAQEVVELAQELYNKDLRPIVAKKAPKKEKVEEVIPEGIVEEPVKKEPKPEFPIDKPKKKRKYYPKKK